MRTEEDDAVQASASFYTFCHKAHLIAISNFMDVQEQSNLTGEQRKKTFEILSAKKKKEEAFLLRTKSVRTAERNTTTTPHC